VWRQQQQATMMSWHCLSPASGLRHLQQLLPPAAVMMLASLLLECWPRGA
jgi:hypothetical protein